MTVGVSFTFQYTAASAWGGRFMGRFMTRGDSISWLCDTFDMGRQLLRRHEIRRPESLFQQGTIFLRGQTIL